MDDFPFTRHFRTALLALVPGCVLLPGVVFSEGAVRELECSIHSVCDAAGQCAGGSGAMNFRIEPIQIDADGAGRYALSYGDAQADAEAQSELGPFYWTLGGQRHALIISSETQWLWHTLETEPAPGAAIRFLQCRFTN